MIQLESKELRIGNYINAHGGNDVTFCKKGMPRFLARISSIYIIGFSYEAIEKMPDYYHKDIEPISITEEWLLKFGFEKEYESKFRRVFVLLNKEMAFTFNFSKVNNEKSVFEIKGLNVDMYLVQFVHQVQNLFHSLTGEELMIK